MNKNVDLAITSLETITAFDLPSGSFMFKLDELHNATIAQGQEKTDITGKQGRKLSSLKKNKTVTISGSNGLVSGGLLSAQTGGDFENKDTEVLWVDYLTVTTNAATTTYKAVGTDGNEIDALYVKNDDETLGKMYTQDASTSAGKFTYDPETKAIAFFSGDIKDNTEIVVYYKRKIKADVLENISDKYSKKCSLYVDAIAEDRCGSIYKVQFYIPKADFNGEFSLELGGDQTVHEFEAEGLAGGCGATSGLWTYTVFGVDTEDSAGA